MRGRDLGAGIGCERLKPDVQQAVAGAPLHGRIGPRLFAQGFAEKSEKEAKRIQIELAQIRQPRRQLVARRLRATST